MYLLFTTMYYFVAKADRVTRILRWAFLIVLVSITLDLLIHMSFIDVSTDAHYYIYILQMMLIPLGVMVMLELIYPLTEKRNYIIAIAAPYIIIALLYVIFPSPSMFRVLAIIWGVLIVLSNILVAIFIPVFHDWLKNHYSDSRYLKVSYIWGVQISLICIFVTWCLKTFSSSIEMNIISNLLQIIFWTGFNYFIWKQRDGIRHLIVEEGNAEDDENKVLAQLDSQEVYPNLVNHYDGFDTKLQEQFIEKQLYLNPSLTLNDVAMALNTNRSYLSYYLNNVLKTSFYDYVHEKRLDYASFILKSETTATLEDVAVRSGFNSLSTFRRAFMKYYGCTPCNFRKK